jgi:hypothetical protein
LVLWAPEKLRDILHALVGVADHPLERRLLAMAALACKEERDFVRRLLREYEENAVTLAMIECRDYRPVDPVGDFGAN